VRKGSNSNLAALVEGAGGDQLPVVVAQVEEAPAAANVAVEETSARPPPGQVRR
jgi:hypothetical protein